MCSMDVREMWKTLFEYEDGALWKLKSNGKRWGTKPVGSINNGGYVVVKAYETIFMAHRVI